MTQVAKITGIGFYAPRREITNEMVLEMLLEQSRYYLSDDDLEQLESNARKRLRKAGSDTRYWCEADEYCTDMALKASGQALEQAGVRAAEIDLIIYAGMSRAFVEPATAHIVRSELGACTANVIDVSDACAGFAKALEIANSLVQSGTYRTILITSGERTYDWGDVRCKTVDELDWKFGSLTIGDAAGALVVQACRDSVYTDLAYHMQLVTGHKEETYAHCHVGLNHRIGDRYRLHSHSRRLISEILSLVAQMAQHQLDVDPDWMKLEFRHLFFHDVGGWMEKTVIPVLLKTMPGLPRTYRSYFAQYGNVASVGLPLNLWLAEQEKRIERGQLALFAYGAAGAQAGALTFLY